MEHILEGEGADYVNGGASALPATPDTGTYSGGQYQPVSWTGDTLTRAIAWELDTTMLSAYAGGWFRIWARFTSSPSGVRITPRSRFLLTTVAEAQEVLLTSSTLQDLGVLQLPPWLRGETGLYPIELALYARRTGGGSFNLDFLQLTPLDSYRLLLPRGYGTPYQTTVQDDGMANALYVTQSGGLYKTGHYLSQGLPIRLYPGQDQRIYFLQTNSSGGAEVARTLSVRTYYRPRRLTL